MHGQCVQAVQAAPSSLLQPSPPLPLPGFPKGKGKVKINNHWERSFPLPIPKKVPKKCGKKHAKKNVNTM